MMMSPNEYVEFVRSKLIPIGFRPMENSLPNTELFHHTLRSKQKYRNEEFCFLTALRGNLTPAAVEQYSKQAFEFASHHLQKGKLTISINVIVYPVIVTEAASEEVIEFVSQKYKPPTRLSKYEFPVVVDLSTKKLHTRKSTPILGAVFYGIMREESKRYFGYK
jgi:hypothetical protein